MNVAVIGLGKLGLPLAVTIAAAGHRVVGIDTDGQCIADIARRDTPWIEPGLAQMLEQVRSSFSTIEGGSGTSARCEVSIVVVSTPTASDGSYDDRHVLAAIEAIGAELLQHDRSHLVIVASTVMPGTMGNRIAQRLEETSGRRLGSALGLCYSPIFAALGALLKGYREPDFVLIGESDANAGELSAGLFKSIVTNDAPILRMPLIDAELAKIAINNFIIAKMSFANMLAHVCQALPGADVDRVTAAMGCDRRIGMTYLRAAMPYGGPCFGRDVGAFAALGRKLGTPIPLSEAAGAVNERHFAHLLAMIEDVAPVGSVVAILGLAFRPATAVIHASHSISIARALAASGRRVRAWDPLAGVPARETLEPTIEVACSPAECIAHADVVVVTNPDPAFAAIPPEKWAAAGKRPVVFDCWRILPAERLREFADIRYIGVGSGESPHMRDRTIDAPVVVTGAGGFIGGFLTRRLRERGHRHIRCVDIKPLREWHQHFPDTQNMVLDLRTAEACRTASSGMSVVFNLACDMGGIGYIEANKADCMLSVLINTHMLLAAREAGVYRFFYPSSACVYAADKQVTENAVLKELDAYPAMPEDGYGWEKLFGERMCRHFQEDFGVPTRVARYHNVYGPYCIYDGGREKAPAALARKVALAKLCGRQDIEIWGDGKQTRSFLFVDDCVDATLLLTAADASDPLNIGSEQLISVDDLVSLLENIAGIKLARRYNPAAPVGVRGRSSDNSAIKSFLGWKPKVPIEVGIEATYRWIHDMLARTFR